LRCQLAVFSAYRIDQFADPDGFKNQLGAVLEQYPEEVITYICDPRTGIQRRLKWPPTISEMVEACDEHREFLKKLQKPRPSFQERPPARLLHERPQGYMAQVHVPERHPRYDKLSDWAKGANPIWYKYSKSSAGINGLWVSHNAWNGLPDPK
jgi:hypothetical protein